MSDTKQKIVETSIALFNQHGYNNVSLHQIAKSLGLSSGNLTYHFPKKESLMEAVYHNFVNELTSLQLSIGSMGSLEQMILETSEFSKFQRRYIFFYMDLLDIERSYPLIAQKHFKHIARQIERIQKSLNYNLQKGILKNTLKSELETLAETIWMTVVFWPSQICIRGIDNKPGSMLRSIKSILKPYIKSKYYYKLDPPIKEIVYT